MKRLLLAVLLLTGCIDWNAAYQSGCVNDGLCDAPDSGTPPGVTDSGSQVGADAGQDAGSVTGSSDAGSITVTSRDGGAWSSFLSVQGSDTLQLLDFNIAPTATSVVSTLKGQLVYTPADGVAAHSNVGAVVVSPFSATGVHGFDSLTELLATSSVTAGRYEPSAVVANTGWLGLELGNSSGLTPDATSACATGSKVGACFFVASRLVNPAHMTSILATVTASVRGLAIDGHDSMVAVGKTVGDVTYPTGCATPNRAGLEGWYVLRVASNGSCFVLPAGGSGAEPDDVAIDQATSNAYVIGTSAMPSKPGFDKIGSVASQDAYTVSNMNDGGATRVLAAYSNDGGVLWAKAVPSWSPDSAHPARVLVHGNTVWVVGSFTGSLSTTPALVSKGGTDLAILGFDALSGVGLGASQLGGAGDEEVIDLSYDPIHGVVVAGTTTDADWSIAGSTKIGTGAGSFAIGYQTGTGSLVPGTQRFYASDKVNAPLRAARFVGDELVIGGTLSGGSVSYFDTPVTGTGIFVGRPVTY